LDRYSTQCRSPKYGNRAGRLGPLEAEESAAQP
jgi:hypothetical protein